MAGCEYLDNIERIGLKSALKFYDEHKTFTEVMKCLQKHKTYKDKIPADYETKVSHVNMLFNYQTCFDPRSKKLTQLQPLETKAQLEKLDMDYMGRHEVFDKFLIEFSQGFVVKRNFESRKRYNG
jgi:5'-3' exonuclease